jgi:hypothetical protein
MERAIRPYGDDVGALQERMPADIRKSGREVTETFISRRMLRQEPDETIRRLVMLLPDMMHAVGARDDDREQKSDEHSAGGEQTPLLPARTPYEQVIFPERWQPHHVSQGIRE